ncbi:MAG: VIT1/CCC1 transporter family protein [Chloroflexota bacterium]
MGWDVLAEGHRHPRQFLGDVILGLNDGIVTTLVFALGVAGAAGTARVVLAGLAEMLAGAVAMFLGAFMASQYQRESAEHQIAVERYEIEHEPDEEREELRRIYREKGFSGPQLSSIVDHLTADRHRWLQSLIQDELLLRPGEFRNPWKVGGIVAVSFAGGAFLPILPFIARVGPSQVEAAALSLLALAVTGRVRARNSGRFWLRSSAEMVLVGLIGTGAGLVIGKLLSS